jgi:L-threonine kinase
MTVSTFSTQNTVSMAFKISSAPATCGELIQGAVEQTDYLVNFPIDSFSRARAQFGDDFSGVRVIRQGTYRKAIEAVSALCALTEYSGGIEIDFLSHIPRGLGLASSTAEIASALDAVAALLGVDLTPQLSCMINAKIEATDCVQAPGISLVNQITGIVQESFSPPKGVKVIMIDTGGQIDTDLFDRQKFHYVAAQHADMHLKARSLVIHGLRSGCSKSIGMAATISASVNQEVLFKGEFPDALRVAYEHKALGVNCAHSGTMLGILYGLEQTDEGALLESLAREFGVERLVGPHQLVGGGTHHRANMIPKGVCHEPTE